MQNRPQRWAAEFIGTFLLVLGGCGAAIFAAGSQPGTPGNLGIGYLGVAFAFGLTVLCGVYALGHVSGGHFNPAVSVGLATVKRFEWKELPGYVVSQCVGAIAAVAVLWAIKLGQPGGGFTITQGAFASNGYGQHHHRVFYNVGAAFITEVVLTALFVIVILGVTTKAASKGMAALGIGLMLTLIHLISIPIDNTSVNPARSLGPALFERGTALKQMWLFILAPVIGGIIGAIAWRFATGGDELQTGEIEAEGVV